MLTGIKTGFQTGTHKLYWLWRTLVFAIKHERWLIISVNAKNNSDWVGNFEYFGLDERQFEHVVNDLAEFHQESKSLMGDVNVILKTNKNENN
jgi:hypothetical protein